MKPMCKDAASVLFFPANCLRKIHYHTVVYVWLDSARICLSFQRLLGTSGQKMPVLKRDTTTCKNYFVTSSKLKIPISDWLLAKHKRQNGKWKMFDEYNSWREEIWKIEVFPNETVKGICPMYLRRQMCIHLLSIQIWRKDV